MTNKSNNDLERRLELCIMKNYYKNNNRFLALHLDTFNVEVVNFVLDNAIDKFELV